MSELPTEPPKSRLVTDGGVEWADFTAFQRDLIEAVARLQDDDAVVGVEIGDELRRWYPDLASSRLYANLSRLADRGVFETGSTSDQREVTYRVADEVVTMFAARARERAAAFAKNTEPDGGERLVADGGTTWYDLTGFQQTILRILAKEGASYGLSIKRSLEARYNADVNHGRLYPNLDDLGDLGLIEIGTRDRRTNDYALTPVAVAMLRRQQQAWADLDLEDEQAAVADGGEETYSHVSVIRILRDDPVNETAEGALWFACGEYHDGDDYRVLTDDESTIHIPTETVTVVSLPEPLPSDEAMDTAREQAKDLIAHDPVTADDGGED